MMLLLFLCLISSIIIFVGYHIRFRHRNDLLSKIPCIKSYPLIGSGLSFFGKTSVQILQTLQDAFDEHGPMFRFDLTPFHSVVIVADPKAAEHLLSSPKLIQKSAAYEFSRRWLGDGLLLSNGKKWHERRKIITPSFHFKILEQFSEIMDSQGKTFISNLKKFEGQHVDFFPLISMYTLDVICESAMGCKINAQENSSSTYVKAVKEISNIIHHRIFDSLKRFNIIYRFTDMYRQELKVLKVLHDFTLSVILARKQELENTSNKDTKSNELEIGIKNKTVFLDMLLKSTVDGQPLSIEDIREEVDTFMFEGHDTITSGIAFVLYNLAKYPKIQQEVFEECSSVLGDDLDAPVTMQHLNQLSYLELVIKESLRLYPSLPFFGRQMTEDVLLGNFMIPKNTSVNISPYLLGRNSDVHKDPMKFDPLRFDVETNNEKNHPYSYVPFSAGPRNCIGQKFAMLELKSIVSKIVRNFELSIMKQNVELQLIAELLLRSKNGFVMSATSRVVSAKSDYK